MSMAMEIEGALSPPWRSGVDSAVVGTACQGTAAWAHPRHLWERTRSVSVHSAEWHA